MKNLTRVTFAICLSMILFGCSEKDLNQNIIENSLIYKNKTYVLNEDLTIKKLENNNFIYNINLEDIFSSSLLSKNIENELIISNELTGEYIEIFNVQKNEHYYTFDLVNNLGNKVEGLEYNGELFNDPNMDRCPACVVPVVGIIVSAAIELLSDSSLVECANAMSALNCGFGTPVMNYSEGWFSTTCNVFCDQ